MSNPPGPENKPLNLGKFNPTQSPEPLQEPSTSEGETMFIRRATAAAVEQNFDTVKQQTSEFGLPMKEMLGVITYCYSRGIFNSGEIAARLKQEPELRKALGSSMPDETTIRRFRRMYAGEIEDALEMLYQAFPPQNAVRSSDPASQGNTAHFTASARVHDAIWTDNKLPGRPPRD